jgi:hypothetical protein
MSRMSINCTLGSPASAMACSTVSVSISRSASAQSSLMPLVMVAIR